MKPSLRNKYFGWLLLLLMLNYLSLAVILFLIEWQEARSLGTSFNEEIPELIAVLIVMLVAMPVVVFVAWHIAGRLLRPLTNVLVTAERIRSGSLEERIPPLPHNDELSRLATTINDAFDRYSAAMRRLDHFSADASHQLRTPLAAIRSTAEVTLQADRSIDIYQEALGDILEQTGKLNQTMDQLLLLSRLDRSLREHFQPVLLAEHLARWTGEMGEILEGITLKASSRIPAGTVIAGDAVLLREVFMNLLNNAFAATPPGGDIATTLLPAGEGRVTWCVEDSGPGIPVEDRHRVFDRFYRGRTSVHKGSGLGLALVREIVLLHGGTIRAETSERLGGAAIVIELPCMEYT
jgi:signal transduction histidine kinase